MKKNLLLGSLMLWIMILNAKPNFTSGTQYQITCSQYVTGCVVDGNSFGQATPIYFNTTATTDKASYWLFNEVEEGKYTIQNAATLQYVTYDGERIEAYKRYVRMDSQLQGNASLWTITLNNGTNYVIRNVQNTDQLWDVRADSYIVGTYSSTTASANQLFSFHNAGGTTVQEYKAPLVGETAIKVDLWLEGSMSDTGGWDNQSFWVNTNGNYTNGTANVTAPFIENWHDKSSGGLADSHLLQTMTNLPNGSYTVSADFIASDQTGRYRPEGTYFVANSGKVWVSTSDGVPLHYNQTITITDGQLTTGLSLESTNCNWVAIDNLHIFFNGTKAELIAGERAKVLADLQQYFDNATINHNLDSIAATQTDTLLLFEAMETYRKKASTQPGVGPIEHCLSNLIIGQHGIVYDNMYNIYMETIPDANFGNDFVAQISYTQKPGYGLLNIDGQPVASGESYAFKNVGALTTYTLSVTDSLGEVVSSKLTFTNLPIVQLYGNFGNDYTDGLCRVYEPANANPELLFAKAKWRGGITNNPDKHKRNYHVKFLDASGNSMDQKFFGLRNDNNWILEACQVDMSRIRNRVLTDLWNDFATKPYYFDKEPKALAGTRGNFVELLLNGKYVGIYSMTENVDRKQMKLKKYDETTSTQHGLLWKASEWSYEVFMGHESNSNYYPAHSPSNYDNKSETWSTYESKYPDIDDYGVSDWEPLWKAINFVCTSTDNVFSQQFTTYFDYPVIRDYYILMESILATDNHGKNLFLGTYDRQTDQKLTLAVWDMDASVGQRWSDAFYHNTTLMSPERDYSEFITNEEHGDFNLFRRMRATNCNNFNEDVRQRYAALRKTYLSTENFIGRFNAYFDLFKRSGADVRESRRWSGDTDISGLTLNFDIERAYISNWITRRLNYLDNTRFKIGELSGIERTNADTSFSVNVYGKELIITSNKPLVINIYAIDGTLVRTEQVTIGVNTVSGLPSGIYVVGQQKVVIR